MDRCLKRLSQHDDRLTAADSGKAQIRSSGPCDIVVQVVNSSGTHSMSEGVGARC